MPSWHSLYLSSDSDIAEQLDAYLTARGYTRYSPFETLPGRAYPQTLRLFIVPPASGWRRILLEATSPDEITHLAETLSQQTLCIRASLNGASGEVAVYQSGVPADTLTALESHLKPGQSRAALSSALEGRISTVPADEANIGGMSAQDMPDRMKSLWNVVNPKHANRMFQNLAGTFVKGEKRAEVQQMLDDAPQWDSAAGKRLRAVMACLSVPANWREPDFVTLRTAYALHLRRQRLPNAPLFPGDAEAMSAVPDALLYQPVYGGKTP